MNYSSTWLAAAAAGCLWLCAACLPAADEAPAPQSTEPAPAAAAAPEVASASGLVVYLDPVTGRLVSEPPPGEAPLLLLSLEELDALSRSDFLLVEEEGPVSGTIVHLEGRFQSMSVATVGRDGKVRKLCISGAALPATAPESPHDH